MKYEMMDAKKIIGEVILSEADQNPNVVVVSTDSAPRTGMGGFIEKYPGRYYEVGIMEQAAVGVSAGWPQPGKSRSSALRRRSLRRARSKCLKSTLDICIRM
jgi:transketolase C-terminal domain/subunit